MVAKPADDLNGEANRWAKRASMQLQTYCPWGAHADLNGLAVRPVDDVLLVWSFNGDMHSKSNALIKTKGLITTLRWLKKVRITVRIQPELRCHSGT